MAIKDSYPAIRPSLDLNFAGSRMLDPRITFSRASSATYFDKKMVMRTAPAGVPRIDHDPVTGECKGLLIEEQRTRLNFVSAAPTAAENVTVTDVAHTVSFYGAGSIVLSGAHVATITGSGAFPTRTNLTFTPTAGTLTITPSGTVQHLQLEVGAFATSVIKDEASQVTRAADTAVMTGTNFSDWYRQDEGTLFAESSTLALSATDKRILSVNTGLTSNNMSLHFGTGAGGIHLSIIATDGIFQYGPSEGAYVGNTYYKRALAYINSNPQVATSGFLGSTVGASTTIVPTGLNSLEIGSRIATQQLNGHIRRIAYYPKRLTNAQLQALTA